MTRSAPLVIGVVAALSLTACASSEDTAIPGSSSPSETNSSTRGPSTSSSSSTSTSTEGAKVDGPEDKQLTLKEAKAALPKLSELPDGYKKDSVGSYERGEQNLEVMDTDPKRCAAMYFQDQKASDQFNEHMVASAHVRFAWPNGGKLRGRFTVQVISYDEPVPLTLFDGARTALATCASFNGEFTTTTRSMRSPDLGDETFAFHQEYSAFGRPRNILFVRSGHNLIYVSVRSDLPDHDGSQLKDMATMVLDNLKE